MINLEDIDDLVVAMLRKTDKYQVSDLAANYPYYTAMGPMMDEEALLQTKDKRITYDEGYGFNFNVLYEYNDSAEWVGPYSSVEYNQANGLATGYMDFRHLNFNMVYDVLEAQANSGSETKLLDYIEAKDAMSYGSAVEKMEVALWTNPSSSSGAMVGIPYWIVKNASEGFNGGDPSGYSGGAGNLPTATYANWKNYTSTYTNVTRDDFLTELWKMTLSTGFMSPVAEQINISDPNIQRAYYVNKTTMIALKKLVEDRNENLGKDLEYVGNVIYYNNNPVFYVPYLDNDTTNPIYQIDWGTFGFCARSGELISTEKPLTPTNQPTVRVINRFMTLNTKCVNRRKNGVIYYSA